MISTSSVGLSTFCRVCLGISWPISDKPGVKSMSSTLLNYPSTQPASSSPQWSLLWKRQRDIGAKTKNENKDHESKEEIISLIIDEWLDGRFKLGVIENITLQDWVSAFWVRQEKEKIIMKFYLKANHSYWPFSFTRLIWGIFISVRLRTFTVRKWNKLFDKHLNIPWDNFGMFNAM